MSYFKLSDENKKSLESIRKLKYKNRLRVLGNGFFLT